MSTEPRSLVAVLTQIQEIAPETRAVLERVVRSAMYAAPEVMADYWHQAADILNGAFASHPKRDEIQRIFSGATPPTSPGETGTPTPRTDAKVKELCHAEMLPADRFNELWKLARQLEQQFAQVEGELGKANAKIAELTKTQAS